MVRFWNAGAKKCDYPSSEASDSGLSSSDPSPAPSPTLSARNTAHDEALDSAAAGGSIVTTMMFKAANLGYMAVESCHDGEQEGPWNLGIFQNHDELFDDGENHPCKCALHAYMYVCMYR